jgi:hypothetical protein
LFQIFFYLAKKVFLELLLQVDLIFKAFLAKLDFLHQLRLLDLTRLFEIKMGSEDLEELILEVFD